MLRKSGKQRKNQNRDSEPWKCDSGRDVVVDLHCDRKWGLAINTDKIKVFDCC